MGLLEKIKKQAEKAKDGAEKQIEKIKGGAEKHDGYGNALVADVDSTLRKVDAALGNVSHLGSSIPGKRDAAEERFAFRKKKTDEKAAEELISAEEEQTEQQSLRQQLQDYVQSTELGESSNAISITMTHNPDLSDIDLAMLLLSQEDEVIHSLVTPWVLAHIRGNVSAQQIINSVSSYDGTQEVTDEAGDNVQELAEALFELHNMTLDPYLAFHLLIGNSADIASADVASAGDY